MYPAPGPGLVTKVPAGLPSIVNVKFVKTVPMNVLLFAVIKKAETEWPVVV